LIESVDVIFLARHAPHAIAPGEPPSRAATELGRHGIEAVTAERTAAGEASEGQETAGPEAMEPERIERKFGAGRLITAVTSEEGRETMSV